MERIDAGTVELTDAEARAWDLFNSYLDCGFGIIQAARSTQERTGYLDTSFYAWLVG